MRIGKRGNHVRIKRLWLIPVSALILLCMIFLILRSNTKVGHRNHKKDDNHLNKHAMHLIRLLMTVIDILDRHVIITCRQDDLPLLMKIRNSGFMQSDGTLSAEFYEVLDQYEHRFQEAAKRTTLPDEPDMAKVGAFVERINRCAIMEG